MQAATVSHWLVQPTPPRLWPPFLTRPNETEPVDSPINAERAPTAATTPAVRPTSASIVTLHDNREHVKARFRLLRRLPANHDHEGAAAPSRESVDRAIAFVDRMRTFPPFFATLADDGAAVIEFEDRSRAFFADITFGLNGLVECYRRQAGRTSEYFEGSLDSAEAREFLESYVGVLL
jgi:hypothetical protein